MADQISRRVILKGGLAGIAALIASAFVARSPAKERELSEAMALLQRRIDFYVQDSLKIRLENKALRHKLFGPH